MHTPILLPALGSLLTAHGGHLGAIVRGPATDGSADYALIVSAREGGDFEDLVWSEDYTDVAGATSRSDGPANTQAMADAGLVLAQRIRALDLGGFTDWYLPAAGELRALDANVPELFDPKDWYWSSTQYSRHYAWCQGFEYGLSGDYDKGNEFRARAVRRIPLHTFNA